MIKDKIKQALLNKSIIGIGTGRTVSSILKYLDKSKIYISSSYQTTLSLQNYNLNVIPLETVHSVDLYIDGCDYFDKNNNLIKGKGGSLTKEKLLCSMSSNILIIVQDYKYEEDLLNCYVPIEVLPCSVKYFRNILIRDNINFILRSSNNKYGPVITDLGNFIFDIKMNNEFIKRCRDICGVVEHGYFSNSYITYLYDNIDNLSSPSTICLQLLKDHPSNINVYKLVYFVIINYDININNYYNNLLDNITSTTLSTDLYFISQVLDNTNISISILQQYIDKIIYLLLFISTKDIINVLNMLYKIFKKNNILKKKKYKEINILEESVPRIKEIIRRIYS